MATLKIKAHRSQWKEIKRIYMSVKQKDHCYTLQLDEGLGFFEREFLITGEYWEIHQLHDVMKLCLK